MLANQPTDIDSNVVSDLSYWVLRACDGRSRLEYHYTYKGITLVVHPKRAARLSYENRSMFVGPTEDTPEPYKGRGWRDRFVADIETAVTTLLEGGGGEKADTFGDAIRVEIALRKDGVQPEDADRDWWKWLQDDELPLFLGCWLHQAGIMSLQYNITRNSNLDFHPTHDEFELGVQVCQTRTLWVTFQKLCLTRKEAFVGGPRG